MTGPYARGSKEPERVGDYQISGLLGEGGQGTVYLGESPDGARVAIKVLHARFAADPEIRRRFLREAKVAASVAAFCTAKVIGTGMVDEQPYIVSEYVPGPSLAELVKSAGPRTGSGLERLAVSTLTALASIHRVGIVHRDFKPGNVILGPEGPVVIDFGIARALDHTTSNTQLAGTPAYMAPEQLTDEPVTAASDMFSWAGTMIFAATGRLAFPADTVPAILHAILAGEPDMSGVSDPLRPLVAACLAKDPGARPTAAHLLRDLTGDDALHPSPGGREQERYPPGKSSGTPDDHTFVDRATPAGPFTDPVAGTGFPVSGRGGSDPEPTSPSTGPLPHGPRRRHSRGAVLAVAAAVAASAVTAGVLLLPSLLGEPDAVGSGKVGALDLAAFPHVDVTDRFAKDTSNQYTAYQPYGNEDMPLMTVGAGRLTGTHSTPFFSVVSGPGRPSSGDAVSILTVQTFAGTGKQEDSVFVGWVKDGNNYVTAWYNNTRKKSGINVRVNGTFLQTPGEIPLALERRDRFALRLSGNTITSYAEIDGEWRQLHTATIGGALATPQAREQYRYGFGLRGSTGTISITEVEGLAQK